MNTDRYTKKLSQNLRTIRKSKGLTTMELAEILGISQAKVSYIEHCKGILSARDVAILSRKLDIPLSEFFRGLNDPEDGSGLKELILHLARYGATLLAKPTGIQLTVIPFEDIFARALGFIEDDRLHKGLCAALIAQTSHQEINVDRIFALIGNNPFLINKSAEHADTCIKIIDQLNRKKDQILPRAKIQISKIIAIADKFLEKPQDSRPLTKEELLDLSSFVEECLSAKR